MVQLEGTCWSSATTPRCNKTDDLEVHAIGAMLHDLGLVLNASWISPDCRFAIDGAFAATGSV